MDRGNRSTGIWEYVDFERQLGLEQLDVEHEKRLVAETIKILQVQ